MSFDATAIWGLIPSEKSAAPRLPLVSFGDVEAQMNKQKLSKAESQLWAHLRKIGDVAVDYPGRKVGMPSAIPYEGVGFPVEIDGNFTFVTIPVEIVTEFAHALIACVPESISQDCELDAKREADIAISRVKGY